MGYGVLVVIENVLATDSPSLAHSNSIPEGMLLLRGLNSVFRVCLSTLEFEVDIAKRFLMYAGVQKNEYDQLLSPLSQEETPANTMRRQIQYVRQAYDLAYVVTADPALAKRCIMWGITPMLCPHPRYAAPSFLPQAGEGVKRWTDMVDTLVEQKFLRESDRRTDDDPKDLE
jgi:hypothetical protein